MKEQIQYEFATSQEERYKTHIDYKLRGDPKVYDVRNNPFYSLF